MALPSVNTPTSTRSRPPPSTPPSQAHGGVEAVAAPGCQERWLGWCTARPGCDGDHARPLPNVCADDRTEEHQAGIVDQDVQASESLDQDVQASESLDHLLYGRFGPGPLSDGRFGPSPLSDVRFHHERCAARLVDVVSQGFEAVAAALRCRWLPGSSTRRNRVARARLTGAAIVGARWAGGRDSGVFAREVAGQLAIGVGLGEEVPGFLFEGCYGVGAGGEAQRRVVLACDMEQGVGELGGINPRLAVHGVPGSDGLLGALGLVIDRGLCVLG
jgi:hypothetical protein